MKKIDTSKLYVGYALETTDAVFSKWGDMLKYWAKYYGSQAEVLRIAPIVAVVETESGLPLSDKRVKKPLTAAEKNELIAMAVNRFEGFYTLENC